MILLILGSAVLSACGGDDGNEKASATPQGYYLALGDSITYGIQPDKASQELDRRSSIPATWTSLPRDSASSLPSSRSSTTDVPVNPL